jgi:hypothetical protein
VRYKNEKSTILIELSKKMGEYVNEIKEKLTVAELDSNWRLRVYSVSEEKMTFVINLETTLSEQNL